MQKLSVVIICKNSASVIGKTLQSFAGLTDDIVVYDNGSTDYTLEIAKQNGANVFSGSWQGFGKTKNNANGLAKYDWILSLDADEAIDEELKNTLLLLPFNDDKVVYDISFKTFLGDKYLKHGEWAADHHVRLFNRNEVKWNYSAVHEELIMPDEIRIEKLKGYVLHRTAENFLAYKKKMIEYASLNAEKYYKQGKQLWWGQQWISPVFSFLQNYIFRVGFLDGKAGFTRAHITAVYTFLKYKKLKELMNNEQMNKE